MSGLTGRTIALAAERRSEEINTILHKKGATTVHYPLQGKLSTHEDALIKDVETLIFERFDLAVFTTGIGGRTLTKAAKDCGYEETFIQALAKTPIASRGYKTRHWLTEIGIEPLLTDEDGTMEDLIDKTCTTRPGRTFLQLYNQDDTTITQQLEKTSTEVYTSQPYTYEPPEEAVVTALADVLRKRQVDAVMFTSKKQVENLLAEDESAVVSACNDNVTAAAVGTVTAQALFDAGIQTVIQPPSQKMGAMVVALDQYFQANPKT
ncbi:uroporphyrinogen-III synthase [Salsuginibacillus halophilus]|uniref:Uroporphyrinogen-III synthase n=1 Tax=Salsuginibacillus halophilus TaxID=517424 RepID=A0A2P8H9Q2_9BACI|nr:uroporphyrinogen-III synthase [Salsuginibacillus halophilus]PSL42957.1 uroporphyrinogen-III synthase [Salsuginibacillus halophilus]